MMKVGGNHQFNNFLTENGVSTSLPIEVAFKRHLKLLGHPDLLINQRKYATKIAEKYRKIIKVHTYLVVFDICFDNVRKIGASPRKRSVSLKVVPIAAFHCDLYF